MNSTRSKLRNLKYTVYDSVKSREMPSKRREKKALRKEALKRFKEAHKFIRSLRKLAVWESQKSMKFRKAKGYARGL